MYDKIANHISALLEGEGFKIHYNNNLDGFNDDLPSELIEGVITFADRPNMTAGIINGILDYTINFAFPVEADAYNQAISKLYLFASTYHNAELSVSGVTPTLRIYAQGPMSQGVAIDTSNGEKVLVQMSGTISYYENLVLAEDISIAMRDIDVLGASNLVGVSNAIFQAVVNVENDATTTKNVGIPVSYARGLTIVYQEVSNNYLHNIIKARAMSASVTNASNQVISYLPATPLQVVYTNDSMSIEFKGVITENTIISQLGGYVTRQIKIVEVV